MNGKEKRNKYKRRYYKKNKKRILDRNKIWRKKNIKYARKYMREYLKRWRKLHPKQAKAIAKRACEKVKNTKKYRDYKKNYYRKNKDKIQRLNRRYYLLHKDEINKKQNIWRKKRYASDPEYRKKVKAKKKEYWYKNNEAEKQRQWRKNNPKLYEAQKRRAIARQKKRMINDSDYFKRRKKYTKLYYEKNRERILQRVKAWQKRNPEKTKYFNSKEYRQRVTVR